MNLTPSEQIELDLTTKLLKSLLLDGEVYSCGSIYDKRGYLMSLSEMAIAVKCLNRLKFKIGNYECKVERIDAGGRPRWALI